MFTVFLNILAFAIQINHDAIDLGISEFTLYLDMAIIIASAMAAKQATHLMEYVARQGEATIKLVGEVDAGLEKILEKLSKP
jgi:hypothetical protein